MSARADGGGDLGMLHAVGWPQMDRWWEQLADENAPKIIARLPFVERPDHPAGTPVFIISNPLAEAAARDVALFSARGIGPGPDDASFRAVNCECLARAKFDGRRLDAGVGAGRLERRKTCSCAQTGAGRRYMDRQPRRTFFAFLNRSIQRRQGHGQANGAEEHLALGEDERQGERVGAFGFGGGGLAEQRANQVLRPSYSSGRFQVGSG